MDHENKMNSIEVVQVYPNSNSNKHANPNFFVEEPNNDTICTDPECKDFNNNNKLMEEDNLLPKESLQPMQEIMESPDQDWKCCCMIISKNLIVFLAQFIVVLGTLIFCGIMLSNINLSTEETLIYSNLLTMIVSLFLGSKMK